MEICIGQYIRNLRLRNGLSLSQLATLLCINVANLSKIETGNRDFDDKRLQHICELFQLDYNKMRQELVSEKIAKQIYANNLNASVLKLVKKKSSIYLKNRILITHMIEKRIGDYLNSQTLTPRFDLERCLVELGQ